MRTIIVCVAAVLLLVGSGVLAQEIIATPDPIGGTKTEAGAGTIVGEAGPARPGS